MPAVIWKMLMISEPTFRKLNAPHLVKQVRVCVEYADGIEVVRKEAAA